MKRVLVPFLVVGIAVFSIVRIAHGFGHVEGPRSGPEVMSTTDHAGQHIEKKKEADAEIKLEKSDFKTSPEPQQLHKATDIKKDVEKAVK